MSIEQDLAGLRARIQTAHSARARAEYEYEQATTRLTEAKNALLTEFGVSTAEQVKQTLTELNDAYLAAVRKIEAALEEAGG